MEIQKSAPAPVPITPTWDGEIIPKGSVDGRAFDYRALVEATENPFDPRIFKLSIQSYQCQYVIFVSGGKVYGNFNTGDLDHIECVELERFYLLVDQGLLRMKLDSDFKGLTLLAPRERVFEVKVHLSKIGEALDDGPEHQDLLKKFEKADLDFQDFKLGVRKIAMLAALTAAACAGCLGLCSGAFGDFGNHDGAQNLPAPVLGDHD